MAAGATAGDTVVLGVAVVLVDGLVAGGRGRVTPAESAARAA
jgi:hypothetical protein